MGTKKGQVRKTARRAYEPKKEKAGSTAFDTRFQKAMKQVWGKKLDNPFPFKKK